MLMLVNRIKDDVFGIHIVGGSAEAGRPTFHPFLISFIPTAKKKKELEFQE